MPRSLIGFVVAVGLVLGADITIMVTLGLSSETAKVAWWLINFPSIPCFLYVAPLIPALAGDGDWQDSDVLFVVLSIAGSCIGWGLLGAGVGRLTAKPPAAK